MPWLSQDFRSSESCCASCIYCTYLWTSLRTISNCPNIQLGTSWRIHFEELCKSKSKSKCKRDWKINVRCCANRECKCEHHGKINFGAMRIQMQIQIYPSGRLNVPFILWVELQISLSHQCLRWHPSNIKCITCKCITCYTVSHLFSIISV